MLASWRLTPSDRRSVASSSVTRSCDLGGVAPCATGANRASRSSRAMRPLAMRASCAVSMPIPASARIAANRAAMVLAYSLKATMDAGACASRSCRIADTRALSGSGVSRRSSVSCSMATASRSNARASAESADLSGKPLTRIAGKPSCTTSSTACHASASRRVGARPCSAAWDMAVAIRRRVRSVAFKAARLDAHARTRPIQRSAPASPPSTGCGGGGRSRMARSTSPSSASGASHCGARTSGSPLIDASSLRMMKRARAAGSSAKARSPW